jgi:hypothetical protein
LRIALCGFDTEHAMPASWSCAKPRKMGHGYRSRNAGRERIWFSPHCVSDELPLFRGLAHAQ